MTTVVTGLFADVEAADAGVAQLVAAGIRRQDISVILEHTPHHERLVLTETDDTARGALTGAVSGGTLASLAFFTLALPSIGVLAVGPLAAALVAGTAGAVAGGIVGTLTGHGVSTMTAQQYETALIQGQALVAVHTTHEQGRRIKQLLTGSGATAVYDAVHFAHGEGGGAAG